VGKLKEKHYREAIGEYSKRLGRYCKLEILETADEKTPDGAGVALEKQIKEKEARRLLMRIKEDSYICALEISGKRYTSEAFANMLEEEAVKGVSHITFIIGGSLGLHDLVIQRADLKISFSDMTFPHQLMRVILMEQIYRAYRIIHEEPYHK
jgi:23S rRNA (pseudouridine1915-N3)-methyltransferase